MHLQKSTIHCHSQGALKSFQDSADIWLHKFCSLKVCGSVGLFDPTATTLPQTKTHIFYHEKSPPVGVSVRRVVRLVTKCCVTCLRSLSYILFLLHFDAHFITLLSQPSPLRHIHSALLKLSSIFVALLYLLTLRICSSVFTG